MICKTCHIDKPLDSFYFRKKLGYHRKNCKQCFLGKCGKYRKDNVEKKRKTDRIYRHSIPGRFSNFKALAKARSLDVDIDFEVFEKLHSQNCKYCGDEFDRGAGYGIDRINSKLGYTEGNSVACCSKCNYAKNDLEHDEFIQNILKIANNLKNNKY
jgi:hypothetical protein